MEPSCFGASNGAISSAIAGGTAPYLFDWSNGPSSSNIYNLTSGWYILEVTDTYNCAITDSVFLDQPSQIIGSITNTTVICPNSSVELGVAAYGGTFGR